LKVYDGPNENARLAGTFCGTQNPGSITSSGRYLTIVFKSDDSESGDGFQINYSVGEHPN